MELSTLSSETSASISLHNGSRDELEWTCLPQLVELPLHIDGDIPKDQSISDEHFEIREYRFNWKHHRHWCITVMCLLYKEVKVNALLAWCNTLGGAYSSLGDTMLDHAITAGTISEKQLMLSYEKGDPYLMSRHRLFMAYSLVQRRKLSRAKRIIKQEYNYLTQKHSIPDNKLINMCLYAWNKYKERKRETKS